MTATHFEKIIEAFQKHAPFRPFVVKLISGGRIKIDHLEALVFRGGVAVYLGTEVYRHFSVTIQPRR